MSEAGAKPSSDIRMSVLQGDLAVSGKPEVVMTAVLGSCVAACLWDEEARVGGMNHFLLPQAEGRPDGPRFGEHAMEALIRAMVDAGARRSALQAKLFGGARLAKGRGDVGQRNADFAKDFLTRRGIPLLGGSLGGAAARQVEFWPATGQARQRLLRPTDAAAEIAGLEALLS